MATPLPFIAPAAAPPPVTPAARTRSDLMAYLLDQTKPDDMVANPPQSFGEGLARTAGTGLDALMAKRVIGQKNADQQQKLNDFADLLEGVNPELAAAARKGVGLDVASQVLSAHYMPKAAEAPTIHEVFDPKTGRKTFAQWNPSAPDVGLGAGWAPLGGVEAGDPVETWEVLTDPASRQAAGIPASDTRPVQRNTATGELKFPGGASTNITMANEKAEDSERGKAVVQTLKTYADDGASANELLQNAKRLSSLLSTAETGTSAGLVDFVRKNTGIALTDDAGPIQAVQALVDYMAPRMRPPGSGASSDFDARQFLASLPSLYGDPVGNAIITQTLGGMAENRVANARIAQDYLVGKISAEEAFAKMQALPDPFVKFKTWQEETGSLPKGAAGAPSPPGAPAAPPAPASAPAPAGGEPARVTNDAEYDALPSGTVFVGPDGVKRRKP